MAPILKKVSCENSTMAPIFEKVSCENSTMAPIFEKWSSENSGVIFWANAGADVTCNISQCVQMKQSRV